MNEETKQPGHHGRPGEQHHFARLTEANVVAMRAARANGAMVKDLAKVYGISDQHVSSICKYKRWAHIEPVLQTLTTKCGRLLRDADPSCKHEIDIRMSGYSCKHCGGVGIAPDMI